MNHLRLLALALLLFPACALAEKKSAPKTPNDLVLAAAQSYPDGGGYNWTSGQTGVPEAIVFKGETILKKTEGTYCCGFTFAVVMKAATEAGMLEDKSVAEIKKLQKAFYGVGKEVAEKQCAIGLVNLGIGREVSADKAQPGDFMQLYRTKGGHSVVFLKWIERKGKRIGFTYRSSQEGTNGIGDRTEYFKDSGIEKADVDRSRIYFGRLGVTSTSRQ